MLFDPKVSWLTVKMNILVLLIVFLPLVVVIHVNTLNAHCTHKL